MARDLKKVKIKKIVLDEIHIDFLNQVLDFYEEALNKREESKLKKIVLEGMTAILKDKINNSEWTGEEWL